MKQDLIKKKYINSISNNWKLKNWLAVRRAESEWIPFFKELLFISHLFFLNVCLFFLLGNQRYSLEFIKKISILLVRLHTCLWACVDSYIIYMPYSLHISVVLCVCVSVASDKAEMIGSGEGKKVYYNYR